MGMGRLVPGLAWAALGAPLLTAPADGQETTRISVDSSGVEGNDNSNAASLSADGQIVAFLSGASNLVAGDSNGALDVFVHDRATGITERVSRDSTGAEANDFSGDPSVSADGQVVAFWSAASNLVAGDTNGILDIFVHDRGTGLTERASVDSAGAEGNAFSGDPSLSADGKLVVFWSYASNLVAGDTNGDSDVFVHDRITGLTERVSVKSSGRQANDSSGTHGLSISADGRFVAFESAASNLVGGDTNGSSDVFVHDRTTGLTERVSVDSSGAEGNGGSLAPSISADGRIIAFWSYASNLVPGDTNGISDIFLHDRSTGITERVSVDSSGVEGNDASGYPAISADGEVVAFYSSASNLVPGDTNNLPDDFVHDRSSGVTARVNVDSSGAESAGLPHPGVLSADGRIVAFSSDASSLVAGDTNGAYDVFVHERCDIDAAWSNYGTGFPGTSGVPSFTARSDPALGASITLDLSNSSGVATAGLLFLGFQRTSIPSSWGGDLVVVPLLTLVIGLPPGGAVLSGKLPNDESLCGVTIDLQALEADAGAAKGVSFSPGLELVLGH